MGRALAALTLADPGVGSLAAAWITLGRPVGVPVRLRAAELRRAMAVSERTLRRRLADAQACELVTRSGQAVVVRCTPGGMRAAADWLADAQRCRDCGQLKRRQGTRCKRCRVAVRHDMANVAAAVREARRYAAEGRRIPVTQLAARHGAPLWTRQRYNDQGVLMWVQGLVRRLIREELLTGTAADYWRECEREAGYQPEEV